MLDVILSTPRRGSLVALVAGLMLAIGGCAAPQTDWQQANAKPIGDAQEPGWQAISPSNAQRWTGGITAVARERPGLPNAGLQLPRVSPNGEWIAFLDADPESDYVSPDQWVTGRGLEGVSLWLRAVDREDAAAPVAVSQAAWPAWSDDSNTLLFVSHDPSTGCALGLHDVTSGRTKRLSVGIQNMLTPSMSPDGRRVAVAGYGEVADQALIFVIDLETGQASPGPLPTLGGAQLMPQWLDDDTLLFVELDEHGGGLLRWRMGQSQADPIAPLQLPASIFDAIHLHAGIARPVSPDGRYFTYYAPGQDRMVWVATDGGDEASLEVGDRAGTWWSDEWFLAANDDRLALVASPQSRPSVDGSSGADLRPHIRLLSGRWAPVWADAEKQSMLLVGEGDTPDRFRLVQLWVVTK